MTRTHPRTEATRRREARRQFYRDFLTVAEMLEHLGDENGPLPRRTWQQWRANGKAPKCYRLPNGQLRCRTTDFDQWLEALEDNVEVYA
ncbi:helix-turn-helix transcriptional regulator [Glycomyces tarimensis]